MDVEYDLILVLRSQFFEYLEHLEAACQEKGGSFVFLPTVNSWLWLTSWKAWDWSGHIFGVSASPRSLTKTGHVTLFRCSWRSAWFETRHIRVAITAFVADEMEVIRLHQLVCNLIPHGHLSPFTAVIIHSVSRWMRLNQVGLRCILYLVYSLTLSFTPNLRPYTLPIKYARV